MKIRILSTLIVLFLGIQGFSQSMKQFKADEKYQNLEYAVAAELYKDVLEQEPDNKFAMLRLANCYRLTAQPEKAVVWYKKGLSNEAQPINRLFYAQTLKQIGNYDEARAQFENYKTWVPEDPRADAGIRSISEAENMENRPEIFQVAAFNSLNTSYNEFGPVVYQGNIFFTSDRDAQFKIDKTFGWTGNPFSDNFVSKKSDDGTYATPRLMSGRANAEYNDGLMSFSPNGKLMAFTRNQYNPGIIFSSTTKSQVDEVVKLKVMLATAKDDGLTWNAPFEASFNNPDFSFTHPSFSPDGMTLYFVSDRPGGYGGTDIWKAELTSDLVFKDIVNLGPDVNTNGDEMFPFVAADQTLYFSSDGHAGLGGLDVFRAKPDANGMYSSIFNLGAPFNSSRDDFGVYTADKQDFYFSSNRIGGKGGDDIYRAKKNGVILDFQAIDATTGLGVDGASVLIESDGKVYTPVKTNKYGKVSYPLEVNKKYRIIASKDKYQSRTEEISTEGVTPGSEFPQKMLLYPDYNAFVSGIVIEEQSQLPVANAHVTLLNKDNGESKTVTTDFTGLYKMEIFPNFTYEIKGDKEGYKPGIETINTKGLQPNETIKQNLILTEGAFVCDIEFKHIYFDFDKYDVREDASTDLEKMYQILKNSSKVRVEIGAHTDSRGSDRYNYRLSDNRAASVVKYLVKRGIDRSRLIPKGYGETELKNNCADGVECDEAQHQRNRRVEFKVINEKNEVICSSDPKEQI